MPQSCLAWHRAGRQTLRRRECYSKEISNTDREPHQRIDCPESNYAECICFGEQTGKGIAIQLLIDAGVESLGHRESCLDKTYKTIGVSATTHFIYQFCAVLELI
jgi:uncharacterized protein YkwD